MDQIQRFRAIITDKNKPLDDERFRSFSSVYNKYACQQPIDLIAIANELGLEVFTSSSMDKDESGVIRFNRDKNTYKIYINEKHSPKRKRFTLAHEIAHYICDKDYLEAYGEIVESKECIRSLNRIGGSVPDSDMVWRDIRANRFAAELLMPLSPFITIWDKAASIEDVANAFNVSTHAAKVRAETLLGQIVEQ